MICSRVTGRVVSNPATTFPSESPTSTMSTPALSTSRANNTSYAVTTTIRRESRFIFTIAWIETFLSLFDSAIRGTAQVFELTLPEVAIRQLRMRDHQAFVRVFFSLDHDNVEVERS